MPTTYDMHSHLDFASGYRDIAKAAQGNGLATICSTVVPSSFVSASNALADFDDIHVSLGMHPWWIAEGRVRTADRERFRSLLVETRFIGEIGLDFGIRHKDSIEQQIEAFDQVLCDIGDSSESYLITIHSVKSASVVLDKLEEHGIFDGNDVIFHWFSGTDDDLGRACAHGCRFSVGMKMLATRSGERFARAIPDGQLLIESDAPAAEGSEWSYDLWMHDIDGALRSLAELRGVGREDIESIVNGNSKALLDAYSDEVPLMF